MPRAKSTHAPVALEEGLRHVNDNVKGITRVRRGRGFRYYDPDGAQLTNATTLRRIKQLAIPPAWSNVWIAPTATGHMQATGRDQRGRKQYRYHERWQAIRDEAKYQRLAEFGAALPVLRAQVRTDLAHAGLPREKVLAVVIRLLETTYMRVGNEEYARENGSFGLTTLRNRHVQLEGARLRFTFTGKSGKAHNILLSDPRLARMVKQCRELPGQRLFQYVDEDGAVCGVGSEDVNEYIRASMGDAFTAKDFRTWAGTLLAASALITEAPRGNPMESAMSPHAALVEAVRAVAAQLGNTPAICRTRYIHPDVLQAFENPTLLARWRRSYAKARQHGGMTRVERALLSFLNAAASPNALAS